MKINEFKNCFYLSINVFFFNGIQTFDVIFSGTIFPFKAHVSIKMMSVSMH